MENEQTQYRLVSIEEMRALAQNDVYKGKFERLMQLMKVDSIEKITPFQINWNRPSVLFDHLIFEQCMASYGEDWKFNTQVYDVRAIAYMKYLWCHPLVWLDPMEELSNNRVVEGRIAAERYVPHRKSIHFQYVPMFYFRDAMLNWFADKLPIADGTEPIFIYYKFATLDIILWHYITENPEKMYDLASAENGRLDPSLVVPFDQRIFLDNVTRIAKTHGGKRAAQIVRLLRKDWKRITTMKFFDIGKMSSEQIEEFRAGLFEGMDYYLEQWESETPQNSQDNAKPATFEFITDICRKEGKVETVEAELRAASKGTAHAMWKTIRTNEALGYLSMQDVSAAKIYKALTAYFGELPYNERNFRDARNKR